MFNTAEDISDIIPDPLFEKQWFLNHGAVDGSDMNVIPAWQKGYTGKNVVVTILDDGIQINHPDLAQNYDPMASTGQFLSDYVFCITSNDLYLYPCLISDFL